MNTRLGGRAVAAVVAALLLVGVVPLTASAAGWTPATSASSTAMHPAGDERTVEQFLGTPAPANTDSRGFGTEQQVVQSAHSIDIVVTAPSGQSTATDYITDAAVSNLISSVSTFWTSQSDGQIDSVTSTGAARRYVSTNTCSQSNNAFAEAAAKFGRTSGYYLGSGSHHLLVIVPLACGGGGVGTVGTAVAAVSTANGGMIWASVGANDLDIVAHEFGHNLGLRHSNVHGCPDTTLAEGLYNASTGAFASGCSDTPYLDGYDVMGAAFSATTGAGRQVNANPPALNITGRKILGVVAANELQSISLAGGASSGSTTATLSSTGLASGRRALQITDPRTGLLYFVDYRGGAGSDSGTLYARNLLTQRGIAPGVRVTTTRADGTSVILQVPPGGATRRYLLGGEGLTTGSGGVRVDVRSISSGVATITVALSATAPEASPTPTPTATPTPTPTPTPSPTPAAAATKPGVPTSVTAVAGNGTATVRWTAPASNGGADITGYTISSGSLTWKTTTLAATVTGLTNGTAYAFRVTATNSAGTSAASAASAAITPKAAVPGAPTSVTAVAGNARATVRWKAPAQTGGSAITGYIITSGSLTWKTTGLGGTLTGLANGRTYTFVVRATNSSGTSPASAASNSVVPSG
ncbi:MAG: fibronectin type III domain-containing protein [Burkholderiaceae bacterium]|nr:fibronectin type III domain-containing protein [Microbacteriaceae bacterium]